MPQSNRANSGAYSGSEMVVSLQKMEERDKSLEVEKQTKSYSER